MELFLNDLANLLTNILSAVLTSLYHNWIPLLLAILMSAAMKVYVDVDKLKNLLLKKQNVSIVACVALGAFTPLCACGTMAVVIGLFTTSLPWGPIMAFLTSSPLMSPDGFILLAGVVGVKFAVALLIASLIIGFGSGFITHWIEKKTDFLKDQTRFSPKEQASGCGCPKPAGANETSCGCPEPVVPPETACGCSGSAEVLVSVCDCSGTAVVESVAESRKYHTIIPLLVKKMRLKELSDAIVNIGLKQILLFFSIFVAIGYLIQSFVPTNIILALFHPNSIFSVPLAALIGLPLYVTGESAIPLIHALMAGGAGSGAMMAFMITGPATSAWVIAGISTFMKRRVIALYLAYIFVGGVVLGYLYDLVLTMGI